MRFLKKLTHPFALVAEGFVVGVLLFATSGVPVFQPGSLSDGSTDSELVVSAFSPGTPGLPLPLPTTACAGMALLGLVSMGRRRKAK